MATLSTAQSSNSTGALVRAGAIAAVAAVVAAVIVFVVATSVLNINVVMPPDMTPMPIFAVVMASAVGAIGGTMVYGLLRRFTSNPVLIFRVVGVVFLLFSLGGPLGMPGLEDGTRWTMVAMHFAAGLPIIAILTTLVKD